MKIGKPPRGLTGDELHTWYEDQAGTLATEHYEADLFKQREARRTAESERDAAKTALEEAQKLTPAEGDVILKGADAKRWGELKDLDIPALQAQVAEAAKVIEAQRLSGITQELGLKANTFTDFITTRGLKVETAEDDTGQHVIVTKGEDGKEVRTEVMEYLQEHASDWLPALVATPGANPPTPPPAPPRTPPTGRLPSGTPRGRPADVQTAFLEERQAEAAKHENVFLQKFGGSKT